MDTTHQVIHWCWSVAVTGGCMKIERGAVEECSMDDMMEDGQ